MAIVAAANATLQISVATDKPTYQLSEAVTISVTAYNSSETETLTLLFPTAKQATYVIDSTFDISTIMIYLGLPTGRVISPLTSYTWTFTHAGDAAVAYPLTIGNHSVVGKIVGYGQSEPVDFMVVPEPATILILGTGFLLVRRKK